MTALTGRSDTLTTTDDVTGAPVGGVVLHVTNPDGSAGVDLVSSTVAATRGQVSLTGLAAGLYQLTNPTTGKTYAVLVHPDVAQVQAISDGLVLRAAAMTDVGVKTGTYPCGPNEIASWDLTGGSGIAQLPSAPADRTRVTAKIVVLAAGSPNSLLVQCQGTDKLNLTTGPTSATLTLLNQALTLQYRATDGVWRVVVDSLAKSQLDLLYAPISIGVEIASQTLSADVTLVAGWNTIANVAVPQGSGAHRLEVVNGVQFSVNSGTLPVNNALGWGLQIVDDLGNIVAPQRDAVVHTVVASTTNYQGQVMSGALQPASAVATSARTYSLQAKFFQLGVSGATGGVFHAAGGPNGPCWFVASRR